MPRPCFKWLLLIATVLRTHCAPLAEFSFNFREGLLWVQVESEVSRQPLSFLFDTGAGVTTVNLTTAKRLGMRLGRKVAVQGIHTSLTGHWQNNVALKAGPVALPEECLAVDLSKLSNSCECPVDGLIGADFLRNRVVEIDFAASKIRVIESVNPKDAAIPLDVRPSGIRIPVTINERKVQFVRLDTGCATALQWVTSNAPDKCTTQVAIGLSELAIPQTTTTIRLGDFAFNDVPTGLHKKQIFTGESGLLGNGLLSRFSAITIDAKTGQLFLRRHPSEQ